MTKEEAMDRLAIIYERSRKGARAYHNKYQDAFDMAIEALNRPQWIPWDSLRFPNDSGTYIVTAYDGSQERVTFAKYQKRLKRWELTGARAYWRVLAWMPLPEPYKERRTDE